MRTEFSRQAMPMWETIDFQNLPVSPWHITQIGAGLVSHEPGQLALHIPAVGNDNYHNAQISDYSRSSEFRWRPPLHMEVAASFSTPDPRGTAGFGFWNHPFVPGERGFRLPQAVWFFFSAPPSSIQLARGVSGTGWKAATLDARRWQFLALLPTAPLGFLLMRVPALFHRLWPVAQSAVGVSECLLDPQLLNTKHIYTIDWLPDGIIFSVDATVVLKTPSAPRSPLGFIAWIDNQYAVVTPQGQFGFGLVDAPVKQTLLLDYINIYAGNTDLFRK